MKRSVARPLHVLAASLLLLTCLGWFASLAAPRAWVNDDAFITFRYAEHVAAGHGMVWNSVEPKRVEGSTSLGWTLVLAAGVRLGIDPLALSQGLGLLAGLLVLLLVYIGARRTLGLGPFWALSAPAFLCVQRQHVLWSVSGMEMSAAALVLAAGTLRLLHEARKTAGGGVGLPRVPLPLPHVALPWTGLGSGLLFLTGSFLRPEAPLLHLAAGAGLLAVRPTRSALGLVVVSGLVHAAGLAALTAWRLAYFGQPLPNPFYVKVGALQIGRGLQFLAQFLLQNHAWLWGGAILVAAPRLWRRARLPFVVLASEILLWCAWQAAIGGDIWEFRFLVPVLPQLALLCALALGQLDPARAAGMPESPAPGPAGAPHPASALARPVADARRWASRLRRTLACLGTAAVVLSQLHVLQSGFRKYGDAFSVDELAHGADYMGLEASFLARYLTAEDRICTGWSGAVPYLTGAWHLDPWGLNEPAVARKPLDTGNVLYHQRHADWADVVANRVMFCDLFNHFLFPRPFDPQVPRLVVPWVEPGVPVYTVRLPEGHHWIFTSARPRAEVEARLARHGLAPVTVAALPAGWPRLASWRGSRFE